MLVEAHAFAFCLSRESAMKLFRHTQRELHVVVASMIRLRDFVASSIWVSIQRRLASSRFSGLHSG